MSRVSPRSVIAVAAHPDDIEFMMAGTLCLLRDAGCRIHYFNLLSGNCGSTKEDATRTRRRRRAEAQRAARLLGATWHPPIGDDLELLYTVATLRRVAAIVRDTRASIVLTHSPQDYMEDHMIASRLAVSAAFVHHVPNFTTVPARATYRGDVTVYHAMPHGLCDGLRRRIRPGAFVNTTAVQARKHAALAAHASQQDWLDASQGMSSYLRSMEEMSAEVGRMSRRFRHAEGWRRHSHHGLSATDQDPLRELLGADYLLDRRYERGLGLALSPY
jgi:LmbE family N-acetylglucosaminyl deacetylase